MKVLEPGHKYQLSNKENGSQELQFFKDLPTNKEGHDGVLCQEVLRALIDRVKFLLLEEPCQETTEILINLRETLVLFEKRAAGRSLKKSIAKVGLAVEQLKVFENGHVFELTATPPPPAPDPLQNEALPLPKMDFSVSAESVAEIRTGKSRKDK